MIHYTRTHWYGLSYVPRIRGSLIPRAMPAMVTAGGIAYIMSEGVLNDYIGWDLKVFFDDPFSMQMFGIVFGYLCIARLNTCYDRYWSGVGHCTDMYNSWKQCALHAISFDRMDDPGKDQSSDPYASHLIQLFTQLSTVAMLKLHSGEPTTKEWLLLGSPECHLTNLSASLSPGLPRTTSASCMRASAAGAMAVLKKTTNVSRENTRRRNSHNQGLAERLADFARGHDSAFLEDVEGLSLFQPQELSALMTSSDPVALIGNRIHRAITTRNRGSGWKVPPPIVNRLYNELSDGMQSYERAMKLKEIAVPFGFVQLHAILLLCAIILTPVR